ncbi:hypothetical protein IWW45_002467 [Coemansia sp. RSA 485]|nr:hypothetical protein IWW45_002467 [Coemansia sp. RSA 485]
MCDFIFIPIFCGTWDQVRSLGPELIICPRCHNNAIQTIKRRTWMTLYCVPIFPISRKRILYHCDICRWEGRPMGTVQVVPERGNHHRNRDLYSPQSTSRGLGAAAGNQRSEQFQPEPYSRNDYSEAPPPPYSKVPSGGRNSKNPKTKPETATATASGGT